MIAIPEGEWDVFYRMSASDMAVTWLDLAKRATYGHFEKALGTVGKGLLTGEIDGLNDMHGAHATRLACR